MKLTMKALQTTPKPNMGIDGISMRVGFLHPKKLLAVVQLHLDNASEVALVEHATNLVLLPRSSYDLTVGVANGT